MTVEIENEIQKENYGTIEEIIQQINLNIQYNGRVNTKYTIFLALKRNNRSYDLIEILPSIYEEYFFVNLANIRFGIIDCTKKPIKIDFLDKILKLEGILLTTEVSYCREKCEGLVENPHLIERPTNEAEKTVYFIQSNIGGAIKIGISGCPKQRMNNLQTEIPFVELTLLATMKGGYKKEKELHKRFSDDCIKNEWFRPSDKLLSYIGQIKGEKE